MLNMIAERDDVFCKGGEKGQGVFHCVCNNIKKDQQ